MKANLKDKKKFGIYVIRNLINNKVYVGKAVDIHRRIKGHITALNTKSKDENIHLINAWHKYGRENFDYYVAEYLNLNEYKNEKEIQEALKKKELEWMIKLNSLDRNFGYNMRQDSEGGMIPSDETRKRLSEANKKRFSNPEEREKLRKKSKEFWAENPEIKKQMKKKVATALQKYRYGKFTKDTDELIKIYQTSQDILEENPDYYLQAIKGCCQGTKASYKGFKWHYIDLETEDAYRREYKYQSKKKLK